MNKDIGKILNLLGRISDLFGCFGKWRKVGRENKVENAFNNRNGRAIGNIMRRVKKDRDHRQKAS